MCIPPRSGQRTGSLTVSATSSTTTWKTACPSSLPGASSACSSQWRGTHDPPAALFDTAPVVKRAWFFPVDGYRAPGTWAAVHWLRALFRSPAPWTSAPAQLWPLGPVAAELQGWLGTRGFHFPGFMGEVENSFGVTSICHLHLLYENIMPGESHSVVLVKELAMK